MYVLSVLCCTCTAFAANKLHHIWKKFTCFCQVLKEMHKKGSPYSTAERRVPELIPVLCSQPAGDVSHKPGGRLPLLSTIRPTVTSATLKRAATNFFCLVNRGTMGVNSLPKTVTRQRRGCDLNPGPSTEPPQRDAYKRKLVPFFCVTVYRVHTAHTPSGVV